MSEAKLKIDSKTTLILDDKTGFLRITGTNTGQDGHEYYYDHGYDLSAANSDQLELFTMTLARLLSNHFVPVNEDDCDISW